MGGPSFQDFVIEKPEHSPHYEYHLHDPDDPKSHRRAVYRFLVRSKPQPFMAALDCADPSHAASTSGTRRSRRCRRWRCSTTGFMVAMAKHFAARVEQARATDAEQIDRRVPAGPRPRPPRPRSATPWPAYAKEHGLANACRVILNLNEFVFVD